jgi:SAM-dependent methyltransferase
VVTGIGGSPSRAATLWARSAARIYDQFLWLGERRGMRAHRRAVLAQARGRTVELGSGTGLNLPHYPPAVGELILTEPDRSMRGQLQARAARTDRTVEVRADGAEALSIEDGCADTVVSTLVLCTVEDPARVLAEVARVLRPGGQLLFIEHVRADSPRLARWQDRLEPGWRRFAIGCRCNRDTLAALRDAGFATDAERRVWRGMPSIVRPLVSGRATVG